MKKGITKECKENQLEQGRNGKETTKGKKNSGRKIERSSKEKQNGKGKRKEAKLEGIAKQ